jgi:hypothetical protein
MDSDLGIVFAGAGNVVFLRLRRINLGFACGAERLVLQLNGSFGGLELFACGETSVLSSWAAASVAGPEFAGGGVKVAPMFEFPSTTVCMYVPYVHVLITANRRNTRQKRACIVDQLIRLMAFISLGLLRSPDNPFALPNYSSTCTRTCTYSKVPS